MKNKTTLFILIFLSLFVFQQTQANARIMPKSSNLDSNQSPNMALPLTVLVYMYRFDPNTGNPTNIPCVQGDTTLGCVEAGSGLTYPPSSQYVTFPLGGVNPILVDVENYYLKNVLPREMNVAENTPTLAALQAQTLSARSIADWKTRAFGSANFDNTTNMQVFVPGSYEFYKNPNDPNVAQEIQGYISQAISSTNGQYLSVNSNGESIDAEFGSDFFGYSTTEGTQGYLLEVQDPISTTCDTVSGIYSGWGMSQKGAIRWSLGNQCASGGNANTAWSVTWEDYRQILVHYYTGIDILNGSGGKIAPDNRWNLLNFNNNQPISMVSGQTYSLPLQLQNTSASNIPNWASNEIMIGYRWSETEAWTDIVTIPEIVNTGDDTTITVPIPASSTGGVQTLHLDVRYANTFNSWFSNADWPDARIEVSVDGPVATSTPTVTPIPNTSTSIPAEGDWIYLGTWENVGCNSEYSFPSVTAKQFKIKMTQGGGWDNRISFYGLGSGGAAWLANGSWQEVNNQSYDLYVGQERETNIFDPAIVNQQRFSVGCNDGETMTVEVYYRITYGATPTPASYPTTTLTIAPTPSALCTCTIDFIIFRLEFPLQNPILCYIFGSNTAKLAAPFKVNAFQSTPQAVIDVELFHRVEDEILSQTAQGQHYIDLYYENGNEIIQILYYNPTLIDEAVTVLQMWEPNLQALVDGQGETVTITNAQVQAVQDFLNHLSTQASPELQQVIANEQIQQPLEQFINVSMDEALEYVEDGVSATVTPSPTITPTFTSTPTFTPSPTLTPTPISGLIFTDSFESGNFTAWDYAETDGGDMSVSTQSPAVGTYGMKAVIDDNHEMVLYDETPNNEKHYSARFYFDPNSMQSPNDGFYIFSASSDTDWVACVLLEQQGDHYSLSLCGKNDANTWLQTEQVLIADEWQAVEIEWKAATAVGANNGYIKLFIGDELAASLNNIDNDTQFVTDINLGVIDTPTSASGTMYFDEFESRTGSHIGLHSNAPSVNPPPARPDALFADTFESNNLNAWNPTLTKIDLGDLFTSSASAYQSSYGLQALIDDTVVLKAVDSSPANETQYRVRFYFDPNSLTMSNNSAHFILDGYNTFYNAIPFRLELLYESGTYKLRPRVMKDDWGYTNGSKYTISNDWHMIEIDWKQSTGAGANNGHFSLWIDGTLVGTIANVDNDAVHNLLDEIRLGATAGVDSTTSGSMFFDNFVSRRFTYIGQ